MRCRVCQTEHGDFVSSPFSLTQCRDILAARLAEAERVHREGVAGLRRMLNCQHGWKLRCPSCLAILEAALSQPAPEGKKT
jgi:hypothetical protein